MAQAPDPAPMTARCPGCGKVFRVRPELAGQAVRCTQCATVFRVPSVSDVAPADGSPARPPEAAAAAPAAPADAGRPLCAVCQTAFPPGEIVFHCPSCGAPYHPECWEYNGGCGVYGCAEAAATEGLAATEIPASYWGKEEKTCPQCNQVILAAAVRCRHCGATFASAKPETAADFARRTVREKNLPAVRRAGLWLLVFSILSCTAPIAAVVGAIWYVRHRDEIRALPSLYGALCKIAVGLAVGQTAVLLLAAVFHGAFGG